MTIMCTGACGLISRNANTVLSSYTLVDGHLPDRILSNAVSGPAPVIYYYSA